jgi:hypothetical protein
MTETEGKDVVLSATTVSNLSYSGGLALANALAVFVGQVIDVVEHNRPALAALDPGAVGISLLVGVLAFFAGWIASALTNTLEKQVVFRIALLSFATPLGLLLIAAMTTSLLAGPAAGAGVFLVGAKPMALPGLIASAAWSTVFFTYRRFRQQRMQ